MIDTALHIELQNLISRYVWALDSGDVDGVCAVFTPDAVMQDTSGARHLGVAGIRAYIGDLTGRPAFRGRQHHIDNLLFEREGEGVRCRAYWTVTQWNAATGEKSLFVVGHSSDLFVRHEGQWRFRERLLHYWNDTQCPWVR